MRAAAGCCPMRPCTARRWPVLQALPAGLWLHFRACPGPPPSVLCPPGDRHTASLPHGRHEQAACYIARDESPAASRATPEQPPSPRLSSVGAMGAPHRALHVANDDAVAVWAPDGAEGRHPPACRPGAASAAAGAPGSTSPPTELGRVPCARLQQAMLPPTRATLRPASTVACKLHQTSCCVHTTCASMRAMADKTRVAQLTSPAWSLSSPVGGECAAATAQNIANYQPAPLISAQPVLPHTAAVQRHRRGRPAGAAMPRLCCCSA